MSFLLLNYPGFISTSGTELMQRFEEHALKSGAKIVCDEVVEVKEAEDGFSVGTHTRDYKTKTVILALGNAPKDLEALGE
ncbi:MAG: hypothetical protein ACUVWK_01395 [Nitrososphaerales archaeon]